MPDRPRDLPSFDSPPVSEVLLGIQFSPPQGYQSILAGDVWRLFADQYPVVQEQPPMVPTFETFGGWSPPQFQFNLLPGPPQARYWFVAEDMSRLLQFQPDRFVHNWRKFDNPDNAYPRFEAMLNSFSKEARKLESFFSDLGGEALNVTQCEVVYFNGLSAGAEISVSQSLEQLSFLDLSKMRPDDLGLNWRTVLKGEDGQPRARFGVEIGQAMSPTGMHGTVMNLSVRGAPQSPDLEAALEFFSYARDVIVRRFAELTTDSAHKTWGRTQ